MSISSEKAKAFQECAMKNDLTHHAQHNRPSSYYLDGLIQQALSVVFTSGGGIGWSLTKQGDLLIGPRANRVLLLSVREPSLSPGIDWLVFTKDPGFWLIESWGVVDDSEDGSERPHTSARETDPAGPTSVKELVSTWLKNNPF